MKFMNPATRRRIHSWSVYFADTFVLLVIGALIGTVVAFFEVIFGYGLKIASHIHAMFGSWWLLSMPFIGLAMVWMFQKYGGLSKKGMNLLFEVNSGKEERIPKRTIPMMTVATWVSHIAGASVGREGVGMQIGAAVSSFFNRHLPRYAKDHTVFLVTGMAAGFAGLFGTPFTAVIFAMEVLVSGVIEFRALAPSISAAFFATWIASLLGLGQEAYPIPFTMEFTLTEHGFRLLILGALFGLIGGFFAFALKKSHQLADRMITSPLKRIFFLSIPLAILLWISLDGRYSGSGANLIELAATGGEVVWLDPIMKLVLTIYSLSIGFIGGEVTPLFAIGSTLGALLAPLMGYSPVFGAALGYAAVFGAGTNTWLAPMVIGMEIFGWQLFPFIFIVCSIASLTNGNLSIYAKQRKLRGAYLLDDEASQRHGLELTVSAGPIQPVKPEKNH